jgi:hypothetical protein
MEKHEVVSVADVVLDVKNVFFNVLIKLVHVDIHEELRGEVAEGEAYSGFSRMETTNYFSE